MPKIFTVCPAVSMSVLVKDMRVRKIMQPMTVHSRATA